MSDSEVDRTSNDQAKEAQGRVAETVTGSVPRVHTLNHEKSRQFIEAALRLYPNVTAICAAAGISPASYYTWRKHDKNFAKLMQDIDQAVTDEIEGVMRDEATKPKSFLDRMAYLRAHRPELYDRAKVVKIEGYKMGQGEGRQRLGAVDSAVDAEIVKTYLDRKQIKEQNKLKALGGGKGEAGEKGGWGE